ncbi:hypothetical protein H4R19_000751 [Coemansia spiralis]|nr:hypothetical protein H4R19_000751 [Coemansia spiralis]
MRLEDLALGYISGIDRDLVVLQGISAQITRVRRPLSPARGLKHQQPPVLDAQPALFAPAGAPPALTTHVDPWGPMAAPGTTRPRKCSKNGSSAPPPIPLHLLLPRGPPHRPPSLATYAPTPPSPLVVPPIQRVGSVPLHGIASPPMSPVAVPNPARFSDAHIEYIGRDCVIHNGTHTVDVAVEYAARRAAPRLVNFSYKG